MGQKVEIRPIVPGDKTVWGPLWRAYLAFYDTTLPDSQYDLHFSRLTGGDPHEFRGFLAWDGDRAVGLVHYLFHRHGWYPADVVYLQDLYAAPEARDQGVGRALIEAVYAAADAEGAAQVYWLTQDFNSTARRLYDRIGRATPFMKYQRS